MNLGQKLTIITLSALFIIILSSSIAHAEPIISFNTQDTSYGQLLIIRGNGFTDGTEYSIKLITPNDFELILQQGLVSGEIGYQHPIESDAVKGNYKVIIETESEKATSEFNKAENITAPTTEPAKSDNTPYDGNVASHINKTEIKPTVEPLVEPKIPSWVKEVFKLWTSGQITDQELINGIEYLIKIEVIQI